MTTKTRGGRLPTVPGPRTFNLGPSPELLAYRVRVCGSDEDDPHYVVFATLAEAVAFSGKTCGADQPTILILFRDGLGGAPPSVHELDLSWLRLETS